MNRRGFLAGTSALAIGLTAGCLGRSSNDGSAFGDRSRTTDTPTTLPAGDDTYRNPVFEHVFPDPGAIEVDGAFVAYGTHQEWGDGCERRLVPIVRSSNLVDWQYVGAAFETEPDWKPGSGLWAPDVERIDGRYVLYYSLTRFGDPNPGIGVATAETPTEPFTDHGKLLRSDDIGIPNSIDPCPVVEDGTPYLFCGSHRGIYGLELTDDGTAVAGEPFQVAGGGVEAPYVIERNGFYYLFGSRGSCCNGAKSTYHVVVGRSRSLRGPYRNADGEPLSSAPGTTILRGNETFAGPGHNSVVRVDDTDWIVYHAYERANAWIERTPRRVLMIDRLRWVDGWPVVENREPSRIGRRPTVST